MAMGEFNALKGSGIDLSQIAIGGIDAIDDCRGYCKWRGICSLSKFSSFKKVMEVVIQAAKVNR